MRQYLGKRLSLSPPGASMSIKAQRDNMCLTCYGNPLWKDAHCFPLSNYFLPSVRSSSISWPCGFKSVLFCPPCLCFFLLFLSSRQLKRPGFLLLYCNSVHIPHVVKTIKTILKVKLLIEILPNIHFDSRIRFWWSEVIRQGYWLQIRPRQCDILTLKNVAQRTPWSQR